jgi:hypothetical protein
MYRGYVGNTLLTRVTRSFSLRVSDLGIASRYTADIFSRALRTRSHMVARTYNARRVQKKPNKVQTSPWASCVMSQSISYTRISIIVLYSLH